MGKEMDMEYIIIRMVVYMKVSGKMVVKMVKDKLDKNMTEFRKSGKMVKLYRINDIYNILFIGQNT